MPQTITKTLYLPGLGDSELKGTKKLLLERNKRLGFDYIVPEIDWRGDEDFKHLLHRLAELAFDLVREISSTELLLIEGSSAGGSMAINVLEMLNHPRIRAISHSGRLLVGQYKPFDWRNLRHAAHLGTARSSQSFYNSVVHCETVAIPNLSTEQLSDILITTPLGDMVVPIKTMELEGAKTIRLPAIGHALGIDLGIAAVPTLAKHLNTAN